MPKKGKKIVVHPNSSQYGGFDQSFTPSSAAAEDIAPPAPLDPRAAAAFNISSGQVNRAWPVLKGHKVRHSESLEVSTSAARNESAQTSDDENVPPTNPRDYRTPEALRVAAVREAAAREERARVAACNRSNENYPPLPSSHSDSSLSDDSIRPIFSALGQHYRASSTHNPHTRFDSATSLGDPISRDGSPTVLEISAAHARELLAALGEDTSLGAGK